MHPHRPRLSNLIATEIREGIAQGRWDEWLPQERLLADELCASRSVIRTALVFLKLEGVIESFQGKGNRIVKKPAGPRTPAPRRRTIGLLTPGSLNEMRPVVTLRMEEFQQQLLKENCAFQIVESKSCFKKHPENALANLRAHYAVDCWVLRLSTKPMQAWFQANQVPAVVLGCCHDGVSLPFVDIDRRALSRHAVGTLIKAGHRNFVLFISKESNGGDLENERGYLEAVDDAKSHYDLKASIVRHEESIEGVSLKIDKILAQKPRPTAIFVAHTAYYLTVACELARRGLKIPQDISLITQAGGSYLNYMVPKPAGYEIDSQKFSRKLFTVVMATLQREAVSARQSVILPTYLPGDSIARLAVKR